MFPKDTRLRQQKHKLPAAIVVLGVGAVGALVLLVIFASAAYA
jgi:hypothetical protein